MAKNSKTNNIKVTLIRSPCGRTPNHRACVRGLGLTKLNHSVVLLDTPCIRGMIDKVNYLLKVEKA